MRRPGLGGCAAAALATALGYASIPTLTYAAADDADGGPDSDQAIRMAADALVVRPISLVATVVGGVVWVVSAPFHALGGNSREASRVLVEDPAAYTFQRPLGDFSRCERYDADGCLDR